MKSYISQHYDSLPKEVKESTTRTFFSKMKKDALCQYFDPTKKTLTLQIKKKSISNTPTKKSKSRKITPSRAIKLIGKGKERVASKLGLDVKIVDNWISQSSKDPSSVLRHAAGKNNKMLQKLFGELVEPLSSDDEKTLTSLQKADHAIVKPLVLYLKKNE